MNKAIYDTPFPTSKPWLPDWLDTTTMATLDGDLPVFVRPGYTLEGTTDQLALFDQTEVMGRWDDQGNAYLVDPVGVVIINGAPLLIYLRADVVDGLSEDDEPIEGWESLTQQAQITRDRRRQEIQPDRPIADFPTPDQQPPDNDNYVPCPAWWDGRNFVPIRSPNPHSRERHPDPDGAYDAYQWLLFGIPHRLGGNTPRPGDPPQETEFLGYFVYGSGASATLNTGLARYKNVVVDGQNKIAWAVQYFAFDNSPTVFSWFQRTTFFRMSWSPYSRHVTQVYMNPPDSPPQYTGLCGYYR